MTQHIIHHDENGIVIGTVKRCAQPPVRVMVEDDTLAILDCGVVLDAEGTGLCAWRRFTIVDGTFTSQRYAKAVADSVPLVDNDLRELSDHAYKTIRSALSIEVTRRRRQKIRSILVIDITAFPFLTVHFDDRDQVALAHEEEGDDLLPFTRDVLDQWRSYDMDKIVLLIIVNVTLPSTILRTLPV